MDQKQLYKHQETGDINSVIYNIYGKEVSEGVVPVNYEYEDIKITGVVGKPEIARSNRSYQLFFVNKRYIKDKTLSASVEQAFKGLLTIGKYGFLVLNIDIDPQKIDVNVHPSKLEIRWQEEQKVFKAVYYAIRESLLKEELVSSPEKVVEEKQDIEASIPNVPIQNPSNEDFKTQTMRVPSFISMLKKKPIEDVEENIIDRPNTIQELYTKKNETVEADTVENEGKENTENDIKDFKIPTEEQIDKMANIINLQKNMKN